MLGAGRKRAGGELCDQSFRHALPPPLGPDASDVEVRAAVMSRPAERRADDLPVLFGDQHEVALEEFRRDLGPRPGTDPVHRSEQLEHGIVVGRGRFAHVHGSSLRSE